jgi:succinylglutamate desuccinylase
MRYGGSYSYVEQSKEKIWYTAAPISQAQPLQTILPQLLPPTIINDSAFRLSINADSFTSRIYKVRYFSISKLKHFEVYNRISGVLRRLLARKRNRIMRSEYLEVYQFRNQLDYKLVHFWAIALIGYEMHCQVTNHFPINWDMHVNQNGAKATVTLLSN